MTDKELLENAAKACNLQYHAYVDHPFIGVGINIGDTETPIWNPLTDDGDAFRLAIKLDLLQSPRFTHERDVLMFTKNTPRLEATRRAIVITASVMAT